MVILINANCLSKTISGKLLFDNATFEVNSDNCIGFLGQNGSGKTTFFKILLGHEQASSGDLWIKDNLKIRILYQVAIETQYETIADFFNHTTQSQTIENQIKTLESKLEDPAIYNSSEYQYILENIQQLRMSGNKSTNSIKWNAIVNLLEEIGMSDILLSKKINELSGGERQKIALASVLAKPNDCDLLLLDEPTNHLDIDTIEWLENKIADFPNAVIIISHDRYLLDDLVDRVFEIEDGQIRVYNSTFEEYEEEKRLFNYSKIQAYKKSKAEIQRQKKVIDTLTRRNKYDRQIASKIKRLEKTQHLENPTLKSYLLKFQFKTLFKSGKNVADGQQLKKSFDDKHILNDAEFEIFAGQKIGLIGPNGCGKTTFLKLLTGEELLDDGKIHLSSGARWAYFDQGHLSLNLENTLIDEIRRDHIDMSENDAKALLGHFNFRGNIILNKVGQLSGGERARIAILRLILQPVNFLILDEPTNHMDMVSKEAIEDALNSYKGTIIVVSHDRRFLDKISDTIFFMENALIKMYSGNYTSFRLQRNKELSELDASEHIPFSGSKKYVVCKKFTVWATHKKHMVGEELYIGEHNEKIYEWALKNQFLKQVNKNEKK